MATREIAEFIVQICYEQLPAAIIEAGKMAILDCLGVTLAADGEPASKIVCNFVRNTGRSEAGVIGEGFQTTADQAAWANGTRGHALDYDDYFAPNSLTPYHPTVVILPAVLAAAEKHHSSGKDVLAGYITGFEVAARIAVSCVKRQYDLGWHTTSTIGSLGAAAAVAKILRLDEEKIRMALGIASSLAGGLRKNFGTMTKPLHAGNAARNGVVASTLAQDGFTADKSILDSPLSFGAVLGGERRRETEAPKIDLEDKKEYYIVSPGIAFKSYPSCAYTHWAIDAVLELKKRAVIEPGDITEIECRTSSALPRLLIHSRPRTGLEGKFSLEFCVAITLIDGEATLKQFSDDKVRNPAVQALMGKVKYVHPREMGAGLTDLGGEVIVKLQNGKTCSHRVDIARGDPRNPLTEKDLEKKYRDCVRLSLSPEDTDRSLELISHLEAINDIAELMDILTFGSKRL